jgi:regulator of RNase E activity RraA
VFPGDVIVGDTDGVVVIPAHLADEIAAETTEMTAFEDFVQETVKAGRGIFGLYPLLDDDAKEAFAKWRERTGR